MPDKRTQDPASQGHTQKDPEHWVSGDEPMTGAQRSYLKTLSDEARQPFDESLSKAAASRRIEELQALTGRGAERRADVAAGPPGNAAAADAPADTQSAMESLGEAISAPVLGIDDNDPTDPRAARSKAHPGGKGGG